MAKELTHIAIKSIDIHHEIETDSMSIEKSKRIAIEQLRRLNYGDDNKSYFWIIDLTPTMIMHPFRQDLEGENLSEYNDINGNSLFNNAIDAVSKTGEGYIAYYWQWQDDSTTHLPKLSYVKLYEKWNWIIGTGVYIDDIDIELNKIRKNELKNTLIISLIILSLLTSITIFGVKTEKQRKKILEKLLNSEEKFRNLFQESNDIIIISNLDGVILDINQKTLAIYDLKYEDVVGKTIFQMMPEKYRSTTAERAKILRTTELIPIEIELEPKKNQIFTVEVKSSLFNYANENVILSTIRDITTRKIAEEKLVNTNKILELSEAKFKQLADLSFEGIAIHENGIILDMNLAFSKMFGYDKNDLQCRYAPEILFDEKSQQIIRTNINNNNGEPYEVIGITKKGKKFPVEVTGRDFHTTKSGKSLRVTAFRDITGRKMQEKQFLNAIIVGEEKERTRIAKELHDGLGPYLSTIKFYFQWLAESDDIEKKKIIIEKGNRSMQEAIAILREVSNNLNPHILTNYGLMDAISAFIEKFKEYDFLTIDFVALEKKKLNHSHEVALYRIVIELLNNTMKHAQAKNISISFKLINDNKLEMIYTDDGKGFIYNKAGKNNTGIGLLNIENRINSLDGELSIVTALNKGFKATITINI